MKIRILILAAATLICASPARADMGFAGAGVSPCSFLNTNAVPGRDSSQNTTTMFIFTWVQGFLSGMNATAYNLPNGTGIFNLDKIPSEMQWNYLVAYCQANPSAVIATAAISLGTKRLKVGN
jgi:hypothetical protein